MIPRGLDELEGRRGEEEEEEEEEEEGERGTLLKFKKSDRERRIESIERSKNEKKIEKKILRFCEAGTSECYYKAVVRSRPCIICSRSLSLPVSLSLRYGAKKIGDPRRNQVRGPGGEYGPRVRAYVRTAKTVPGRRSSDNIRSRPCP